MDKKNITSNVDIEMAEEQCVEICSWTTVVLQVLQADRNAPINQDECR
jgi:hypothetical protein